ncbi:hypothetical protein LTR28_009742 [Elasticomyces elasticus]|nr:hypothetical protein LTR28_009742 [Elasticomyces elasticus]
MKNSWNRFSRRSVARPAQMYSIIATWECDSWSPETWCALFQVPRQTLDPEDVAEKPPPVRVVSPTAPLALRELEGVREEGRRPAP